MFVQVEMDAVFCPSPVAASPPVTLVVEPGSDLIVGWPAPGGALGAGPGAWRQGSRHAQERLKMQLFVHLRSPRGLAGGCKRSIPGSTVDATHGRQDGCADRGRTHEGTGGRSIDRHSTLQRPGRQPPALGMHQKVRERSVPVTPSTLKAAGCKTTQVSAVPSSARSVPGQCPL